jgi:hypothetical protein
LTFSSTSTLGSPWIRSIIALTLTLPLVGAFAMVRPDMLVVEEVAFDGHRRAGPAALRHLAEIRNGTTLFGVDLDAAARGVERHPWVRSARAFRSWPAGVVIEVEEYEPVALLHFNGLHYVSEDGVPFAEASNDDLDYPNLTGIDRTLESLHPELPRQAIRNALWLLSTVDERGLLSRDEISEVSFSRTRGLTVHIHGSRVIFGLEAIGRQVDRLAMLLDRGELDLSRPHVVDLAPSTVAIVRPLDPFVGG